MQEALHALAQMAQTAEECNDYVTKMYDYSRGAPLIMELSPDVLNALAQKRSFEDIRYFVLSRPVPAFSSQAVGANPRIACSMRACALSCILFDAIESKFLPGAIEEILPRYIEDGVLSLCGQSGSGNRQPDDLTICKILQHAIQQMKDLDNAFPDKTTANKYQTLLAKRQGYDIE